MGERIIASTPIAIAARPEVVWAVLVDLDHYALWNPLNRRVESSLELGAPVKLWVSDTSITGGEDIFVHRLQACDPPLHLAWGYEVGEIRTRRDQYVEPTAAGCIYRTTDTFFGPASVEMANRWGGAIRRSFDALSRSLKHYAEAVEI